MFVSSIKYQESNLLSKLINEYLDGSLDRKFYSFENTIEGYEAKIEERKKYPINRDLLIEVLKNQNKKIVLSQSTISNIEDLKSQNTFTVTTGHQLNLMGGPVYFVYKIASVIKLSIQLKEQFPKYKFVPIYWMASEDHDFQEINHFYIDDNKIEWYSDQKGAVGRFKTQELKDVFKQFSDLLPKSQNSDYLIELFKRSYLENNNLSDASRYLVNELFSDYGLLILDGDDKKLKESFSTCFKSELLNNTSYKSISQTNKELVEKGYKIQVNPREINLFYLKDNSRERIVFDAKSNVYFLNDSKEKFSKEELLSQLQSNPESFSPNAVLRPVYQEFVLPNLSYIGGGGELAYWFELKSTFDKFNISFPILTLRDGALIVDSYQWKKMEKLNISIEELFSPAENIIKRLARENSDVDLHEEFEKVQKLFEQIVEKFGDSHPMNKSMNALKAKQDKLLSQYSKKIDRFNKKQIEDLSNSVYQIYDFVLPKGKIQERRMNFSNAYSIFSDQFIQGLIDVFEPLEKQFTILINK